MDMERNLGLTADPAREANNKNMSLSIYKTILLPFL
jgi:hypothetical protein